MTERYTKTHVFLDIETLPALSDKLVERIKAKMKAPANYKKQETIDKWIEGNTESAIRKTSFDAKYGSILCIGLALDDEEPTVLIGNEVDILTQLSTILNGIDNPVFVGHNIREFDIKFIIQRQMINGLRPLFAHCEPYYQRPIADTMEIFSVNPRDHVSLDDMCFALGVDTPKGDIDGSKVYDYWLGGQPEKIYKYCADDVAAMRECFYKMTSVK